MFFRRSEINADETRKRIKQHCSPNVMYQVNTAHFTKKLKQIGKI